MAAQRDERAAGKTVARKVDLMAAKLVAGMVEKSVLEAAGEKASKWGGWWANEWVDEMVWRTADKMAATKDERKAVN